MKRYAALTAAVLAVLALAGCQADPEPVPTPEPAPAQSSTPSSEPTNNQVDATEELWSMITGFWSCVDYSMQYFMEFRYDTTTREATREGGWFYPGGHYRTNQDKLAYAHRVTKESADHYTVVFWIPADPGEQSAPEISFTGEFDTSDVVTGTMVVDFNGEVLTFEYSSTYEEAKIKAGQPG